MFEHSGIDSGFKLIEQVLDEPAGYLNTVSAMEIPGRGCFVRSMTTITYGEEVSSSETMSFVENIFIKQSSDGSYYLL